MRVGSVWLLIAALVLLQRGFAYSAERVVLGTAASARATRLIT
jgi:hypothetical protein